MKTKINLLAMIKKPTVVKQSSQSLIEGFTPHQQAEFDKGITIENYAKGKGIIL